MKIAIPDIFSMEYLNISKWFTWYNHLKPNNNNNNDNDNHSPSTRLACLIQ